MKDRRSPRFFLDAGTPDEYQKFLDTLSPDYSATALDAADRVCGHEFELLGSGPAFLGHRIDWHSDCITGHPGVKITPRAFGRDRRLPITNRLKP